ncbi:hypothetical protein BH09MYX1_BH09MYX1_11480 [soil metagenome]
MVRCAVASTIAEVERRIEATRAGIILVPSRILRRVIKRHLSIPGVGLDVPHAASYVVTKESLLAIATEAEIGTKAASLPMSVILLPRPEEESADVAATLAHLWQHAFHATIHQALEQRIASGALSPAMVRARVHRIGRTELDEARHVLRQDDLLLPPHDANTVYVELVATYLELFHFAPDQLARTFPALAGRRGLEEVIAQDLDVPALLASCRPEGSARSEEIDARARVESAKVIRHGHSRPMSSPDRRVEPPPRRTTSDEPESIRRRADAAAKRGNLVRAMLIRAKVGTRGEAGARINLVALGQRLALALEWPDAPVEEWASTLYPLLPAASRRFLPWNVEGRLLYDLLRACIDHEREIFTISVVEWAVSLGKRPIRRALRAQREVRVAKHLLAALHRVESTRLEESPKNEIKALLYVLQKRAEDNIRRALRPRLVAAFTKVGLVAKNIPEEVSEHKLIEELIDHVVEHRFLSLGQLRDAISRNHVKLRTLRARELVFGDALLELDLILATKLDGVYRRAEIYVRGLQKLSSVMFGTVPGRLLVPYLLLPVVCAYVLLEGIQHLVGPLLAKSDAIGEIEIVNLRTLGIAAAVIFALIHSRAARFIAKQLVKVTGHVLRFVFIGIPGWFWRRGLVQAIVKSRPVQLTGRFLVKPLLLTAVAYAIVPFLPIEQWVAAIGAAVIFILANVVLNSRIGAIAEEAATDWAVRTWRRLHMRILPGLLGFVVAFFRRMIELMDRAIYAVDELLRFRDGQGRVWVYLKGGLGIVWFFVTYSVRLYVNLLVEPEINPIKHFPVVTVAAKLMIPISPVVHHALSVPLNRLLGPFIGEALAVSTVFVLPGFFGFLVWELKENWKIYEQNRARDLSPVVIGQHGETMIALLRPGLHSGTLPKIYSKLRRASEKGKLALYKQREALTHVEEALRRFVERELVDLLDASKPWRSGRLDVGEITMASNRLRITLGCPTVNAELTEITFEEQAGWLLGSVSRAGFIDALDTEQRIVFENALAGLYKVAGVDLVRERVSACLGGLPYDVTSEGLLVWPDTSWQNEVVYELQERGKLKAKRHAGDAALAKTAPVLQASDVVFRSEPLLWTDWVDAWKPETKPTRLITGPSLLPPNSAAEEAPKTTPTGDEPAPATEKMSAE